MRTVFSNRKKREDRRHFSKCLNACSYVLALAQRHIFKGNASVFSIDFFSEFIFSFINNLDSIKVNEKKRDRIHISAKHSSSARHFSCEWIYHNTSMYSVRSSLTFVAKKIAFIQYCLMVYVRQITEMACSYIRPICMHLMLFHTCVEHTHSLNSQT